MAPLIAINGAAFSLGTVPWLNGRAADDAGVVVHA